jgi:hypothetical protein
MSVRRAAVLALLAGGCNVYGPALLLAGPDAGEEAEACATTCGSTCVDLQTDKNNCGACGHTCEAGCSGALCTPTVLTSGLGAPHAILVHGTTLYVANHGGVSVQMMSTLDGTGLKNFAASQLFPDRLATDGTSVFWTADANVATDPGGSIGFGSIAQTQCAPGYTYCFLARNLPSPYGIALQGGTIFVTTLDATNNGPTGCAGAWTSSVLSCPASTGCAVTACATSGGPTVLASGQTQLAGIAADAQNVYWADFGAHEVRFCPQPTCAGGPKVFAQIAGSPFDVASDGSRVYFTDRTGGKLYACPTTGCGGSPTVLASGLDDPALVAVDAKSAYVTLYAGGVPGKGAVARCDLPSCSGGAVTVAAGLHAPYGVALDSSYVYWSEEGSSGSSSTDGSVSKLRR